jgi:hypothetical protein
MKPVNIDHHAAAGTGLGAWLLFLCAVLLVWQPLNTGIAALGVLNSLPLGGTKLALVLVLRLVVTAFGVAAGLALLNRRSAAVAMTRISLIASTATDLIIYATPFFPSNRGPGETPYWVAGSLVFCAAWLLYLNRSKRVHRAFERY